MTTPFDASIGKTQKILEAIEHTMGGTTVAQTLTILGVIALAGDADRSVSQEEIADRVGASQGAVSKHLYKFVQAGLLKYEEDALDRRVKRYPLTAKGRAFLDRIKNILEG